MDKPPTNPRDSGLETDPIMAFVPGVLLRSLALSWSYGVQGKSLVGLFAYGDAGVLFPKSRFQKNVFVHRRCEQYLRQYAIDYRSLGVLGRAWASNMEISG
jgi:hypothetical protein